MRSLLTALVTAALSAISNIFSHSKQRSEQKNRADVIKGKVAADANKRHDEIAKAVADQDVHKIRNILSE